MLRPFDYAQDRLHPAGYAQHERMTLTYFETSVRPEPFDSVRPEPFDKPRTGSGAERRSRRVNGCINSRLSVLLGTDRALARSEATAHTTTALRLRHLRGYAQSERR